MPKRSSGEGSARKRKDGRWEWSVQLDGKRHYVYGATRQEAHEKYKELRQRFEAGADLGKKSQTVEAYLT
ncbi:hypothetical protein SE17_43870, partial [Kouleothrix aurantiaca]